MNYKKFFMPIDGGAQLEERIYGALLVAKYFNVHLEILHSLPAVKINRQIPTHIVKELEEFTKNEQKVESEEFTKLVHKISSDTGVKITKEPTPNEFSVHPLLQYGDRSAMVAQESKYSDLVVLPAPTDGILSDTFEAVILNSGKPVIVIPRIMEKFDAKNIIIAWNNSRQAARAITSSIELLKSANKVHLVSSPEYLDDNNSLEKIKAYLSLHGVKITSELLKTTLHPGEALLNTAQNGGYDMIVIGAYGHDGLKELMFGGATKYLLKHSKLPMFMTN